MREKADSEVDSADDGKVDVLTGAVRVLLRVRLRVKDS